MATDILVNPWDVVILAHKRGRDPIGYHHVSLPAIKFNYKWWKDISNHCRFLSLDGYVMTLWIETNHGSLLKETWINGSLMPNKPISNKKIYYGKGGPKRFNFGLEDKEKALEASENA